MFSRHVAARQQPLLPAPRLGALPTVQVRALLWLPGLCHVSFALQQCRAGVPSSVGEHSPAPLRTSTSPPLPTPRLPTLHRLHRGTKPAAALLGRGLLGRVLKDYPGSDNFFLLEQNSSHRKQSSSAWETTAWGWPNLEQGRN